ncbi:MAG: galactokinase [Gemmatimonadetes bacterium]|jgi:galactokinase|nr:galactokinase [Gemmatimonadota bacterium]MBT5055378.1 galactokinase [Gemmatimonadota bacterium]MBT5144977.1 galactokinase [Gemmatimonadota bacterium]MBT5588939.1 galactokinase [Gemmatimonadota bacterium]MBT5963776.1 galactokinase [Gemmatimonadota bacterium]
MTDWKTLADLRRLEALLRRAGLDAAAIGDKPQRFARAAETVGTSDASALAFFVPGRIEVLGKHTDYCGGHSLVTAVERGFCIVACPRQDDLVRVFAQDEDEEITFCLDPNLDVPVGTWTNYPMTVGRRLARNFPDCRTGADIAFSSDLPVAAGMSSSSALLIATYLVLATINKLEQTERFRAHVVDELTRAEYLGTHENGQSFGDLAGDRGVGTFGGSEDHTAILCSTADHLGLYSYCPTRAIRQIRLPNDLVFVVGSSGVVAHKTGAAQELYNRASLRSRALVSAWQKQDPEPVVYLADITSKGPPAVDRLRTAIAAGSDGFDAQELSVRLDHFLAEEELLTQAADALAVQDVRSFGQHVDRSQELTDTLLGNQVPETRDLARLAREQGALAASAFGAGFGGSVWSLVPRTEAAQFTQRWSAAYVAQYPVRESTCGFFATGAGPCAFPILS